MIVTRYYFRVDWGTNSVSRVKGTMRRRATFANSGGTACKRPVTTSMIVVTGRFLFPRVRSMNSHYRR